LNKKPVPAEDKPTRKPKDPFMPPYGPNSHVADYRDEEDGEEL